MSEYNTAGNIFVATEEVRLDAFISANTSLSRSRAVELITNGFVSVNNIQQSKKYKLKIGDKISVLIPPDEEIEAKPENIPLDVYFEDDDIIVINKPQGMVVHPAPGNPCGTLVNALLFHCKDSLSGINGKLRPGIVHRIDKDTSGLLIVAKNDKSHIKLAEMFHDHSFVRKYEAIVYGTPKDEQGTVNWAIGRSQKDRKKMAFYEPNSPNAKNAITHYRVIERFRKHARVELTLETGRTHQIRVHMLSLSCPVLGDPLYASGRDSMGLNGQCLHAKFIEFSHPITGELLSFEAPLPQSFTEAITKVNKL